MKTYIIVAMIIILTGCAPKRSPFNANVTEDSMFHLQAVTIATNGKCPARPHHFTDSELQKIFMADIKEHLCEMRKCTASSAAGDIIVDLAISYTRIQNGENIGRCGSYIGAHMGYEYSLSKDG